MTEVETKNLTLGSLRRVDRQINNGAFDLRKINQNTSWLLAKIDIQTDGRRNGALQ